MPPIPREIWRLGGVLLDRGLDVEKLFLVYGDESEVLHFLIPCHTGFFVTFTHFPFSRVGTGNPKLSRHW